MDQQRPRLLYIDAYDSFANNIVALLETELEAEVQVIEHDDPRFVGKDDHFLEFLKFFDAAVAGPGPGDPRNDADVGIIKRLWMLQDRDILPVLGICLGFQSLCKEFGAEVCSRVLQGVELLIRECRLKNSTCLDTASSMQYFTKHLIFSRASENSRSPVIIH
jgi:para-aminobenzoate synthetase